MDPNAPARKSITQKFDAPVRARPRLGPWLAVVTAGEVLGTVLGATRSAAEPMDGPGPLGVVLFASLFGAVAGALFGGLQARVLSAHVRRVGAWVLGSAAGWAVGLPFAYVAGSLGPTDLSVWQALGLGAGAASCMGASVAIGTFVATRSLEPRVALPGS